MKAESKRRTNRKWEEKKRRLQEVVRRQFEDMLDRLSKLRALGSEAESILLKAIVKRLEEND